MTKVCQNCGKKGMAGNNVSHSNRRTRTRRDANLQSRKVEGKKLLICNKCWRTKYKTA